MTATTDEATFVGLISDIRSDVTSLVRDEVLLFRTEVKATARAATVSSVLLVVAAFSLLLALIFLLFTAVYVLVSLGLATWAAFLIVSAVLLLAAAIVGYVGVRKLKAVGPPERAMRTLANTSSIVADTATS